MYELLPKTQRLYFLRAARSPLGGAPTPRHACSESSVHLRGRTQARGRRLDAQRAPPQCSAHVHEVPARGTRSMQFVRSASSRHTSQLSRRPAGSQQATPNWGLTAVLVVVSQGSHGCLRRTSPCAAPSAQEMVDFEHVCSCHASCASSLEEPSTVPTAQMYRRDGWASGAGCRDPARARVSHVSASL